MLPFLEERGKDHLEAHRGMYVVLQFLHVLPDILLACRPLFAIVPAVLEAAQQQDRQRAKYAVVNVRGSTTPTSIGVLLIDQRWQQVRVRQASVLVGQPGGPAGIVDGCLSELRKIRFQQFVYRNF